VETSTLNNNSNRDIEVVKAVLMSGNSVELPATGYSMFPTLKPGDLVMVKPVAKNERQQKGAVIVCIDYGVRAQRHKGVMAKDKRQKSQVEAKRRFRFSGDESEESADRTSVLVMHRLLEITDIDSENPLFITRGDSRPEADDAWSLEQLLGEAVSYKRSGNIYLVKKLVPGFWRYKYNSGILWMMNILIRIRKRF
jgi:hypothetical protein